MWWHESPLKQRIRINLFLSFHKLKNYTASVFVKDVWEQIFEELLVWLKFRVTDMT